MGSQMDAATETPTRPLQARLVRLIIVTVVLLAVAGTGASLLRRVVAPAHHRSPAASTRIHASRN